MKPFIVGAIFARGGSKGLPRKNIKVFNGKPLIAYAIEIALASKLINRVIVSTDDAEIKTIASRITSIKSLCRKLNTRLQIILKQVIGSSYTITAQMCQTSQDGWSRMKTISIPIPYLLGASYTLINTWLFAATWRNFIQYYRRLTMW